MADLNRNHKLRDEMLAVCRKVSGKVARDWLSKKEERSRSLSVRRIVTFLLVTLAGEAGILGVSRLQKLVYVFQKRFGHRLPECDYAFVPYRFGPVSAELRDDVEFLENMGFIRGEATGAKDPAEIAEDRFLATEYELSSFEIPAEIDNFVEKRYFGVPGKMEEVMRKAKAAGICEKDFRFMVEAVEEVLKRYRCRGYDAVSLGQLIMRVYLEFPESAANTEVRHVI